jgi:hypothetical protein
MKRMKIPKNSNNAYLQYLHNLSIYLLRLFSDCGNKKVEEILIIFWKVMEIKEFDLLILFRFLVVQYTI